MTGRSHCHLPIKSVKTCHLMSCYHPLWVEVTPIKLTTVYIFLQCLPLNLHPVLLFLSPLQPFHRLCTWFSTYYELVSRGRLCNIFVHFIRIIGIMISVIEVIKLKVRRCWVIEAGNCCYLHLFQRSCSLYVEKIRDFLAEFIFLNRSCDKIFTAYHDLGRFTIKCIYNVAL